MKRTQAEEDDKVCVWGGGEGRGGILRALRPGGRLSQL